MIATPDVPTIDIDHVRSRLASGKRIRSRSTAPMRQKGGRRVRIHTERRVLADFLAHHQRQFPTVDRLICALAGKPLPGELCGCKRCFGRRQSWPAGYRRQGKSYECWLHSQSKWFLLTLEPSTSIVRYGF